MEATDSSRAAVLQRLLQALPEPDPTSSREKGATRRQRGVGRIAADNGSASPPVDVFLVGSAHSGSTFLGGLLAESLDATYVGETAHLPGFVERYRLFDQSFGCLRCASYGQDCPVWTPEIIRAAELAGPAESMSVFRRASGSSVVIDGSKWPAWLRLAMRDRPASASRVLVVIVVRSPLSFTVSAAAATGAPAWEVAQRWRDVYVDAFRTANRLRLPILVARNEDVRQRPGEIVSAIARLVGQEVVPDRPRVPVHSLGGNLWVHRGYSEATWRLYATLGLPQSVQNNWRVADWHEASQRQSAFDIFRPKTERDALVLVQALLDCPGLTDVANLLGYEMSTEINSFVGQVPADPAQY